MLAERAPNVLSAVSENLKLLNGGVVGIDIDAVTQATDIVALKNVSRELGKVILKEDITSYWELAKIGVANGMSEQEAMSFARRAWNQHEVYANSPPVPGIKTLLDIFDQTDTDYIFISSRPIEFEQTTRDWFKKTFPWVESRNIILGRKEHFGAGDFKAKVITERGIKLHIEDALEEALVIADVARVPVIIVPQPWNIREKVDNPRIKHLKEYSDTSGVWPVLKFLVSSEAKNFLNSVAQY